MNSRFLIHVAGPAFITPDTGVIVQDNLFKSTDPTATGLWAAHPNVACWF